MKDLIVFDLDGTLALVDHRRHFVERPNPDWPAFFAACVHDEPNNPVLNALWSARITGFLVMIVSGRSDEVRPQTVAWLGKFVADPLDYTLVMRPAGDFTPDDQLKRRWLNDGAIPRDRVLCAYDDRDKVVKMWRDEGIPCFQVAPGEF